ncbi:UNVERIFIED_CONTAM: hypothetical protein GTU68_058930 [Idotea baltica]|nr:hypothetical protein [Idotea baltica]
MNPPSTSGDPATSDDAFWSRQSVSRADLLQAARAVAKRAHSPYSEVCVGAVLLDSQGNTFEGCNVENASYGLTICAERNAIGRAVADGAADLVAVAIATNQDRLLTPCGACRQVLMEFAPNLVVVCVGTTDEALEWTLSELLPSAFHKGDLPGRGTNDEFR